MRDTMHGSFNHEEVVYDVTKDNFLEVMNDFFIYLPKSRFVAIDEEMSGIYCPNNEGKRPFYPKSDDPGERYNRIKGAAEKYSIIQLGITLFVWNDNDVKKKSRLKCTTNTEEKDELIEDESSCVPRLYNFYVFPSSRDVVMNSQAIGFLSAHGMDFNTWLKKGITCANAQTANEAIRKFERRHAPREEKPTMPLTPQIKVTRQDDITFIARTMASLREWIDSTGPRTFALPSCNSFRRRVLYETIGAEYPSLTLEKGENYSIVVLRLNEKEKIARVAKKKADDERRVQIEEVGLFKIFDALSKANKGILSQTKGGECSKKIPIIVHNGIMDILFLLTHFHSSSLPSDWDEAKTLIHSYFPALYDTKYMVSLFAQQEFDGSGLSKLYTDLFDGCSADGSHNAAFDAFMTGAVFYKLCKKIVKRDHDGWGEDEVLFELLEKDLDEFDDTVFGRNKLKLMQTMFDIDLESSNDPMVYNLDPASSFRISNIDPSMKTSHILQAIHGHSYHLHWLDETSFVLSATTVEDKESPEEMHNILSEAFSDKCRIEVLETILKEKRMISKDAVIADNNGKMQLGYDYLPYVVEGIKSFFGYRVGAKKRKLWGNR